MKAILLLNLFAVGVAIVAPNEFLASNSYMLYGLQLITMIPYLLREAVYVENLFLPTFFVLVYFLVNMTFGSLLVPMDYGIDKEFTDIALSINTYNLIVPFLLLSNMILFWLTAGSLRQLRDVAPLVQELVQRGTQPHSHAALLMFPVLVVPFAALAYLDVYMAFSFQLVILLAHLTDPSLRGKWYRWPIYGGYLVAMVAFDFDNKREIAMSLFLMIFLEVYYSRTPLRFGLRNLIGYAASALAFFALVLAASIMRGYGSFQVTSMVDAFSYIPQYMTSELFADGLTDNLELNFNYGVTITSIDQTLRGIIDYQHGASLIKVLFLPIPRDSIPYKPESVMQLFTRIYAPERWLEDGSLPVMFASDMFMNFNYLGLLPFALVWGGINRLFVAFHTVTPRSFAFYSCAFLVITVLMFARGSGLELWLLYYLFAIPMMVVVRLLANGLRVGSREQSRWII